MKKKLIFSMLLLFLFLFVCGNAAAGQGRMAGMVDPYGLVPDPSDFLIHPSQIAKGEETRYYGYYRFTYTSVDDWDMGNEIGNRKHDADGEKYLHEGLVGFSTSIGSGRMGLFFEYTGEFDDLDIDGRVSSPGLSFDVNDDIDNDFHDFALRLIFGVPHGDARFGGEVTAAYRNEENEDKRSFGNFIQFTNIFGPYRYQLPYDSNYWEASLKGGIQIVSKAVQSDLTVHGSMIFAGDNERDMPFNRAPFDINIEGDVDGWDVGADFWLRFLPSEQTSFPFVFSINYQKKERDADGSFAIPTGNASMDNEIRETSRVLTAGGGIDHKTSGGSRVAAGVYYNFIQNKDEMDTNFSFPLVTTALFDSDGYPMYTEHQIMLKLVGEMAASPSFAFLVGLNAYYGLVDKEYETDLINHLITEDAELDGSHWGINGAIGVTVNSGNVSMEPFVSGGYRVLDLDGNRDWNVLSTNLARLGIEEEISEWLLSVGCSISF
jgi:hypothetical protein